MTVPVVFIQKGPQNYFHFVYQQACKNNNQVFVIGDDHTTPVKHAHIKDLSNDASKFSSIYQHLSTNGYDMELICFNRWFILKEFMEKQGMDKCLHLDSDVMLYANAEDEFKKFDQFDFTLIHRCCGSNSFFTLKGLTDFCNFLMKTYSNKSSYEFERIAAHYHVRQKHGLQGGVCDMTLLEFYSYGKCGLIGEMMHIIDGSTYDHNINTPDQNFRMSGQNIKEISFYENKPYCFQTTTGKEIRFNTLHFQGPAKRYIEHYAKN